MSELNKIALKILENGKGILAADESTTTMTKRLEGVNVSIGEILEANPQITDPRKIKVGDVIIIPIEW